MSDQDTFGTRLRTSRQRAGFHTITTFVNHLSERGLTYSDEAIGHWENGRRKPPTREIVLTVLSALSEAGAFTSVSEINEMLWSLDWRDLDSEEQESFFSSLNATPHLSNLPAQPYHELIGRDGIVEDIAGRLLDRRGGQVTVLSGLGGIGKTAIAYEVAEQVMQQGCFESLAWETARSEEFVGVSVRPYREQLLDWPSILISITRQLGEDRLLAFPPDQLQLRLRDVLRQSGALLVLDNLESLDAVRDVARSLHEMVSPSGSDCASKVLITSRKRLVDQPYVHDRFIPGLSPKSTIQLLQSEARQRGAKALLDIPADLAEQLYTVTGGMPLAIKLIVSQHLLGVALDAELARLEIVDGENELYRFIYSDLWKNLDQPSQLVLVALAGFASSAQEGMIRRIGQLDEADFSDAVARLIHLSLIHVNHHPVAEQQRYDMHAMTRWFVNAVLPEAWDRSPVQG